MNGSRATTPARAPDQDRGMFPPPALILGRVTHRHLFYFPAALQKRVHARANRATDRTRPRALGRQRRAAVQLRGEQSHGLGRRWCVQWAAPVLARS